MNGHTFDLFATGSAMNCDTAASQSFFAAASDALAGADARAETIEAVDAFIDRYVARGRTPADDLLDRWQRDGTVQPQFEFGQYEHA